MLHIEWYNFYLYIPSAQQTLEITRSFITAHDWPSLEHEQFDVKGSFVILIRDRWHIIHFSVHIYNFQLGQGALCMCVWSKCFLKRIKYFPSKAPTHNAFKFNYGMTKRLGIIYSRVNRQLIIGVIRSNTLVTKTGQLSRLKIPLTPVHSSLFTIMITTITNVNLNNIFQL